MIHDTLQAQEKKLPLITVIIPVYNAQDYLAICIQSVLDQTYKNFEIICVDDGSTDRSAEIIQMFMREDARIRLIQIENHGQGYARNLALKSALGKYILFLDADDYIENITLDLAVTRAEKDQSDFVVFDWRYFKPLGQTSNYCNSDKFFSRNCLENQDCLQLLDISSIFTVNKLYRKEFLEIHSIRYGEDYIYEDNPFWISVVLAARKVSLIHSPLYRITIHEASTTKTDLSSDKHCTGFIRAISESIYIITQSADYVNNFAKYTLVLYFLKKFIYYYFHRTPHTSRKKFLIEFVNLMSQMNISDENKSRLLSFELKHNIFSKKRYRIFQQTIFISAIYKPFIKKFFDKGKLFLKKIRNRSIRIVTKIFHIKPKERTLNQKYTAYTKHPLYSDVILFMGFDFRYTGNSRYLFEEMLKQKTCNKKLFFVTNDPLVPKQYRIEPNSDRCNRFIARSKVIIFESWIPLKYKKRSGAIWVQLWHGTPLKRMLFDSNEKEITEKNPNHKTMKYKDIMRWDYLIVDNPNIKSYFQTSFLFPPEKMISCGYPRVKYLLSKKSDVAYKNSLRRFYGIPEDKKIVLYLPTWRDYNYHVSEEQFNIDYILDLKGLQKLLGNKYQLIYKDHVFLSKAEVIDFKNYNNVETQELLLIADYLITDYSSAMFDAFAIDLPVLLFCNDFDLNEESRGVYAEMWKSVSPYRCENLEELAKQIKNYSLDEQYYQLQKKYGYQDASEKSLSTFIQEI